MQPFAWAGEKALQLIGWSFTRLIQTHINPARNQSHLAPLNVSPDASSPGSQSCYRWTHGKRNVIEAGFKK